MRLAVIFSGGKDSTYALIKSMEEGHEIKYLVTLFPHRQDSWMFHHSCIELTKLQAESLGIKHIVQDTFGEKEEELKDLVNVLENIKDGIDGVVTGAIASQYQKTRIDNICKGLGLLSIAPLWGMKAEDVLKEEIENMDVIVTSVSTAGMDERWLGRKLDENAFNELMVLKENFGIHVAGEGGELDSLVIDAPQFKKRIEISDSEKIWDSKTGSGYLKVKDAKLVSKD